MLAPALVADLADWRQHLHARSFTRASVDMLLRDLRRSVPSALGYTLVLGAAAELPEVSITVARTRLVPGQVLSRLTFDLPVAHGIVASVTFYAGAVGALDPLAAVLASTDTFGAGQVLLAGPLDEAVEPGVHGLEDHTKVNYAFGVLLARGRSADEAARHLRELAERVGTLPRAAEHLLSTFNS